MPLRYSALAGAQKRYSLSCFFMSYSTLNEKFPVDEKVMIEGMSDIHTMYGALNDVVPNYINYNDLNHNKNNVYEKLTNSVEKILQHDVYMKGLRKMAHLVILTVLYSAHHDLETFNQFHRVQPPQHGKRLKPTVLTRCLALFIKYKMSFYSSEEQTNANKTASQYNEEYQDDFAIIEKIVGWVGHNGETFYFSRMFKDILAPLDEWFWEDNESVKEPFPKDDHKDGVRGILFLMLQVCILSGGRNPRQDFTALWRTYKLFLEEKNVKQCDNVYHSLGHHLLMLTVGFTHHESFSGWEEIKTAYQHNPQGSNMIVKHGKVDFRWLLSISSILVMNWMILRTPHAGLFEDGENNFDVQCDKNGTSGMNEKAKIHFNHLRQLGKSLRAFQDSIQERQEMFVKRMKFSPILMYSIIKIREKKDGKRYRPNMKSGTSSKKKKVKGVDLKEHTFASIPPNLDLETMGKEEANKLYRNINMRLETLECWKLLNENPEGWFGTHSSDVDASKDIMMNDDDIARHGLQESSSDEESNFAESSNEEKNKKPAAIERKHQHSHWSDCSESSDIN